MLFTSRAFSTLPWSASKGKQDEYPTKDEFADYLESYASHFELLVQGGRKGIIIKPRMSHADGQTASFSDESMYPVRCVIWSVGYEDYVAWLDVPEAIGPDGRFRHTEGISPVPGLFYLGRPWQLNRASALIMGVGDDAAAIVGSVNRYLKQKHQSAALTQRKRLDFDASSPL